MGPFANQLKQVSMTYVTRRWFSALAVILLIFLFSMWYNAARTQRGGVDLPGMFTALPAILSVFIVAQAKAQFAHFRAALLPHFAPAHVFVVALLLLASVVIWPVAISSRVGWSIVGVAAMSAAVAATGIWGMHRNNNLALVSSAIFFSSIFPGVGQWWTSSEQLAPVAHWLILVLGWAAIAAWLIRLTRLREESDDYMNVFNAAMGPKRIGAETSERRRLIAWAMNRRRPMSWIGDWWHGRLGGYHGGSQWQIARKLRYGSNFVPPEFHASLFCLAMAVFMAAWIAFFRILQLPPQMVARTNIGIWHYSMLFPSLSGCLAGLALAERRGRIAEEIFFPLSRPRYFDSLLLSVAWQTSVNWAFMAASMGVLGAYLYGSTFLGGVPAFVLLSATMAAAGHSVSLHLAAWNSLLLRILVSAITIVVCAVPLALWWNFRDDIGEWPFVIAAFLILVMSARTVQVARAKWLRIEFG